MGVLNRENEAVQLALVAIVLLGLALTENHLRYVKPGMRPWLFAAGVVLVVLAVTRAVEALRADDSPDVDSSPGAGSSDRDHGGGAGRDDGAHEAGNLPWLLVLPLLAVALVTPAPLGAYSAARQTPRVPPPVAVAATFPPLPEAVDGAHELTLVDFTDRALADPEHQMAGEPIRLTGFVAPARGARHGSEFLLTRFILSCCAADGIPVQVRITGLSSPVPQPDTWVAVEGVWRPDPDAVETGTAALVATKLREIPPPTNPYEG